MIAAIIQARMGSSRLPGKVLADIGGHPMLWHVVHRVLRCRKIDQVLVATTTNRQDDLIEIFCKAEGVFCVRGSEHDVLERYCQAASLVNADVVVRITSDCPFIDPEVIDTVVEAFVATPGCDYASNTSHYTYPDGLDVEVFSSTALSLAGKYAESPLEREHVTPYLRTSTNAGKPLFSIINVENEEEAVPARLRLTVDEQADLDFARLIYERLGKQHPFFGLREVLHLLQQEPELMEINQNIMKNEGLYKSLLAEKPMEAGKLSLHNSLALKAKAEKLIPSCSQTFSKGPSQFVQGVAPVYLERGEKAHVWDVDGNEYVDTVLALAPIILGYCDPCVDGAVQGQLKKGVSFSLPHRLEIEVAEKLVAMIPCAEMVRFGKNGSDATSGAIRVARAYTGREMVACCGYHGWQDWYIGTTTRNAGVPKGTCELTKTFSYNDLSSLEEIFSRYPGQVAAVIMEPVSVDLPRDNFLVKVRELTHANGAVLIFDEMVTGFRLAKGGAQEYFGITPDMACFGKALANGFPLSAVTGHRDLMRLFDEIFYSFTFGGETVSLAAANATMQTLLDKDVIGVLWEQGERLQEGFNVLTAGLGVSRYFSCKGLPPRTVMDINAPDGVDPLLIKGILQQEMIRRGVLWAGYHNVCFSLSEADVMHVLRAYRAALPVVSAALESGAPENFLEGEGLQPVFRKI
jgi:glutamate-1-semialdehyde 2,1-aminomutase/spore coat polysaccharide biosynthesis protein SpsF